LRKKRTSWKSWKARSNVWKSRLWSLWI